MHWIEYIYQYVQCCIEECISCNTITLQINSNIDTCVRARARACVLWVLKSPFKIRLNNGLCNKPVQFSS